MYSTCIDNLATRPGGTATRRRGVAEIELLLIIIVILLPMLFLIGGAKGLGGVLLEAVYNAENNAYTQVVAGGTINVSNDPIPAPGIIAVRPDLPNRIAYDRQNGTILLDYGSAGKPRVAYSEQAAFLDPSWHLSAFPGSTQSGSDNAMITNWFQQYVAEDHSPDLTYSLGLRPPGPP